MLSDASMITSMRRPGYDTCCADSDVYGSASARQKNGRPAQEQHERRVADERQRRLPHARKHRRQRDGGAAGKPPAQRSPGERRRGQHKERRHRQQRRVSRVEDEIVRAGLEPFAQRAANRARRARSACPCLLCAPSSRLRRVKRRSRHDPLPLIEPQPLHHVLPLGQRVIERRAVEACRFGCSALP